jgi:hypothetical protein
MDLSEATGTNSLIGKFRSASTCNIFVPTIPVAPTTATFIVINCAANIASYFLIYLAFGGVLIVVSK